MPSLGRLGRAVPRDVWVALAVVVLLRLALSALGLVLWLEGDLPGPCHFEIARDGWAQIPPLANGPLEFPLVGIWQRWDACWYSKVATFGYLPDGSTTFLPLMPAAMRLVSIPLGGDVALAGLVVSGVAMVVALVGLQRLVAEDLGVLIARRTVWLVAAWPTALYWAAPFTEALFLATSVWAFRFARQRRWVPAGLAAALAVSTRLPGILLVLPLAWEAGRAVVGQWRAGGAVSARSIAASAAAVAAPALTLGAIVAVQVALTHTNLFDSQDAWGGRDFHAPWETVAAAWNWIQHGSQLRGVEALNLAALLLCAALAVLGIGRIPPRTSCTRRRRSSCWPSGSSPRPSRRRSATSGWRSLASSSRRCCFGGRSPSGHGSSCRRLSPACLPCSSCAGHSSHRPAVAGRSPGWDVERRDQPPGCSDRTS